MNSQSEKIPHGWRWVKLKEVGVFKSGGTPSKKRTDYWNGEIPFVTGADITELYISKNNARAFLTREGFDSGKTVVCKAGTVLIVTRTRVGRIGIAQETIGASQDITTFKCGNKINQEFLYWYLCKNSDYLVDNSRGSTIQGLTRKFVANIEIPLPPLCEQQRIAGILNQQMAYVEKARQAAEEILEAAQALPGAFLRQAFPAHGDALPAGWKLRCLCDLCTYDRKTVTPSNPLAQTLAYIGLENVESNSGRIMLNTGDSSSGQVKGNSYRFDARHVLYGKLRPYLNKVVLPEFSGRCSTELIPLLPGPIDREYLAWYLRRPETVYYAMRSKTGSRMPRTDMKAFMQMPVLLPPLSEQKRIAALLNEQMAYVETVRMSAREQLDAINALPAALLRRAFAGGL